MSGRPAAPRRRTSREAAEPERTASVTLPGGPIPYVIRRSPRSRRLRVTIHPDRGVVVTLPPSSRRGWARAEHLVESFLAEREAWLRRHLASHAQQRTELADRGGLRDGSNLRYVGDLHRLRIVEAPPGTRRSTVARRLSPDEDALVVTLAGRDRRPIDRVLSDWFREQAKATIDAAIAAHGPALGVAPTSVTLRDPRSRWGSASREGRLSFSWRLILAPHEALETVVIHELAHLRVFGHGPRFWALVASRQPDHLEWRRWLRRHSYELHAALLDPAGPIVDPGGDGDLD